jgi:hypothetical protein
MLDDEVVTRVLASFPGLKVERRDGYLVAPWHGREDSERGEAFAARLQAETGCLVADRRNGRLLDFAAGGDGTAGAGDQRPAVPGSGGPVAVSRRWP